MPITIGNLGRLASVSQRGRDIVFSFESSDLVLTPLLPNVIRHTWVPTHWRLYAEPVADAFAVDRRYWPAGPAFTITETADIVRVHAGELLIEATRDPFHIRYFTTDRHLFLEEAPKEDCHGPIGITRFATKSRLRTTSTAWDKRISSLII